MEDEQQNFLQMMDSPYPTILPETQMPLEQSSGQEQDLEGPSVDPFRVPNLDDPNEQEKLNKGLSTQSNAIELQQRHDSLEEELKAIENQDALKCLNKRPKSGIRLNHTTSFQDAEV